jgi:hypothetical protein
MSITIDNSNYINTDPGRSGVYGSASSESVRNSSGSAYVSSRNSGLTAGSTIPGEIVEKDGNEVTIRLGNDQTISAKLQGSANVEVGMKMTFEVAKGAGNQMSLRPLYSNLANNNAAVSALRAAGLPVNDTTLAMTDKMMSESMPVNRAALGEMFRNVSAHSNVSPESIVQMTKLNMPLTDSNVIQFDNYRNFEHQITNDVQNVADGVADVFKEAVSGSAPDAVMMFGGMTAGEVIKEVLDLIDTDSLETITPDKSVMADGAIVTPEMVQTAEAPDATQTAQTAQAAETAQTTDNTAPVETASVGANTEAGAEAGTLKSTVDGIISGLKGIFTPDTATLQANEQAEIINENITLSANEQQTLTGQLSDLLLLAEQASDIRQPLDPSQIMKAVKELVSEYPPENVKVIEAELAAYSEEASESADEEKLSAAAQSDVDALAAGQKGDAASGAATTTEATDAANIANNPEYAAKQLKLKITEKLNELLKSDGFTKLIKDSVKSQMSVRPEEVAQKGKIEELYDRIQKTSAKITQLMENIGRSDSPVAQSASSLSDNVNFMNQLNEFVNYVQLPLKMAGEDANGELYVYTNKKNLANKDGNYSALLHLDMEHLGPMDVYVSMRNYTKVSTNFYLQTEELLEFVEAHIDELTKRLTEKGYDTSMKVSQKDPNKPITPITDEFTKEEMHEDAKVIVSKMRFDVRA